MKSYELHYRVPRFAMLSKTRTGWSVTRIRKISARNKREALKKVKDFCKHDLIPQKLAEVVHRW